MECTVTSDSKTVKAAGHRVTQDQRAHNGGTAGPNLRVGSHGAERGSSREGRNRISGLGHLRATAAATAPTMSRAATAGRRREAGGRDFHAGSGGGERALIVFFWEGLVRGVGSRRGGSAVSAAAAAAAAGALLLLHHDRGADLGYRFIGV